MNKKINFKFYIFGVIGFILLLGLDRLTKHLALEHLRGTLGIDLIPGVLRLEYLENTGAAFGVMQGQQTVLLIITVLVLGALIYEYTRIPEGKKYVILRFLAVFIAAGAVGNMIDRFVYNFVVDFIYFKLINFPVFNVADCYITVAVLILFFVILFYYKDDDLNFLFSKKKETIGIEAKEDDDSSDSKEGE